MESYFTFYLLVRLFFAAACGFVIGYERKNRLKYAGLRTHMIVALGAALMMIVSKYGFTDVLQLKGVGLDPSRIAAQIVSGISFLGAGTILVKKQNVNGLTTAAGIWSTAGVGMAIGSGLYIVGFATTLLILLIQVMFHREFNWLNFPSIETLKVKISANDSSLEQLHQVLTELKVEVLDTKLVRSNEELKLELSIRMPAKLAKEKMTHQILETVNVSVLEF